MPETAEAAMMGMSLQIDPESVDDLLEKEWLLTNSRGSYSSSTVIGCSTRRYHGLLVASLLPPVERVVTLSNLLEMVRVGSQEYSLASFEFSDRLHPQGHRYLKEFRRDTGVHFRYELGGVTVEKSIYLAYDQDVVLISYDFSGDCEDVEFSLLPMVAMRDFHSLQSSPTLLNVSENDNIVTVGVLDPQGPAVHFACREARFDRGSDWWYAFHYRWERRRGQQDYEDVLAPGSFEAKVKLPGRITLVANATRGLERPGPMDFDVDEMIDKSRCRNSRLIELSGMSDDVGVSLTKAADQFIVRRQVGKNKESASIMAGYHWFADWGRDTFISLPGLLLDTGRLDEACEVLATFGDVVDQGMIPNRFDDYGGEPHYNSVDASLWFVHAAYQYLLASGDDETFQHRFRPKIAEIVQSYRQGTRDNIHADTDELIIAGDSETQLTWMDAKCNGVSFTPRYGKAVEINSLWINAVHIMAETATSDNERRKYVELAEKAEESFSKLFWNESNMCLNDCILPDGTVDAAIRPNQIFAVSLPFSCLLPQQQCGVVEVVSEQLLTPFGLRSLSPVDSRYQGHYRGDQFQRDSAYHQGTVWAFLMGPFIEAYLKAYGSDEEVLAQAREIVGPLFEHLSQSGCLGSVSEIFNGDLPHWPQGCVAQAWSVAALVRCRKLLW